MWVDFTIDIFISYSFVYDFWIKNYGEKLKEDFHCTQT